MGRGGRGSREALGGEVPATGVLTSGGEAWSRGGVGDRGGRDVVGDGDGVAGHQSPRRGRHRVQGGPGKNKLHSAERKQRRRPIKRDVNPTGSRLMKIPSSRHRHHSPPHHIAPQNLTKLIARDKPL